MAEAMSSAGNAPRLSGIDALRAVCMLLGVVFHAMIAYCIRPQLTWPYDDQVHHAAFDFLYLFIHSFRMPLFFLIAGYFTRMLYYKTGERGFIRHRIRRIGVPFLFSLIFILPFTVYPFLVWRFSLPDFSDPGLALRLAAHRLLHWNGMTHLWFLYYLLIYYAAVIICMRLMKWKPFANGLKRVIMPLVTRLPLLVTIGVLATWLALCFSGDLYLHVDTGIIPGGLFLGFYAIFFIVGWFMQRMPQPFAPLVRNMGWLLTAGIGGAIAVFSGDFGGYFDQWNIQGSLLLRLGVAIQIFCLVLGVIGFFLRYLSSAGPVWRWISDASYWMYLTHLGIIAGLQVAFIYLDVYGFLRFPLVLIITMTVTLLSYQWFVRYSFLGDYLHGKRERNGVEKMPNSGEAGE